MLALSLAFMLSGYSFQYLILLFLGGFILIAAGARLAANLLVESVKTALASTPVKNSRGICYKCSAEFTAENPFKEGGMCHRCFEASQHPETS